MPRAITGLAAAPGGFCKGSRPERVNLGGGVLCTRAVQGTGAAGASSLACAS